MIKLMVLLFLALPYITTLKHNIQKRLIGGDLAQEGEFPYAAAIYMYGPSKYLFCGGTILNHKWILTAGQCVNGARTFTIYVGANYLEGFDPHKQTITSKVWFLYPTFDPNTLKDDLGLIETPIRMSFGAYISAVDLLPTEEIPITATAIAIGWGQTSDSSLQLANELRYVILETISNGECKTIYGNQITDQMVCLTGVNDEGTCKGDTGGPLLYRHSVLIGVTSFISGHGCEGRDPSGFTRIFPYLDWIKNMTGRLG